MKAFFLPSSLITEWVRLSGSNSFLYSTLNLTFLSFIDGSLLPFGVDDP